MKTALYSKWKCLYNSDGILLVRVHYREDQLLINNSINNFHVTTKSNIMLTHEIMINTQNIHGENIKFLKGTTYSTQSTSAVRIIFVLNLDS